MFLPALLPCKRLGPAATVRWGAQRKEKVFTLSDGDGLTSHTVDYGDYTPKELLLFAESFRKSVTGWELTAGAEVVSLPSGYWTPDYQLVHAATGEVVRLEILGFWRRTDAEKLYRRLVAELDGPFILAVSEQFNIDEAAADEWGGHIYRFKRTPLPAEIVRLADAQIAAVNPSSRPPGDRR